MTRPDFVRSFQIEGMNVRGRVVHLTDVADRIIAAHNYPDSVSRALGEALALVSLLGASLKFEGTLTLQTRSDGPLRMLVADYTSPGTVRGCATFDREAVEALGATPEFAALVGTGSLAITIDQGGDMERYQGIVPLEGDGLGDAAINYFERSEQIPTRMALAVATLAQRGDQEEMRPHWRVGGIMIQNLASLGGRGAEPAKELTKAEMEDWNRASILFSTVETHELVDPQLEPERLLYRLFNEDGVRVFEPQTIEFGCRCSAERVVTVLQQYSPEEVTGLAEDDGFIRAKCEFCSTEYKFTPRDVLNASAQLSS